MQELSKENQLLKRAVAIQNTRLQVRPAITLLGANLTKRVWSWVSGHVRAFRHWIVCWLQELGTREQEVQQLRQMLEGYQQKVQQLEVQNYSLAMHLRQATDSRDPLQAHKNPDIF